MMYISFFLIGFIQDILASNWVYHTSNLHYRGSIFAGFWAVCNSIFVLTLASSLDWALVPFYAVGVACGTLFVVVVKRRNNEHTK